MSKKTKQQLTTKKDATELKRDANQAAFLVALAESGGHLGNAAKAIGISRGTHYLWLKDPAYQDRYEEAMRQACSVLEDEARRRAVEGTEKPVFYLGEQCGKIREYSDTLLIFLMKGAMPGKYRERVEHSGPNGKPIQSEQVTKLVIVEDANWYGNQDRLTAEAAGTPAISPAASSEIQGS